MSIYDTIELERSLLRLLTKSTMTCRRYLHSVRGEWFTGAQRQFLFRVISDTFSASKSVVSEKIFAYEVDRCIDEKDRKDYIAEWNYVTAVTETDAPNALMDRLREAHTGRSMMDDIERIVEKTEEGDVLAAVSMFKRAAVSVDARRDDQPIVELTDYQHRLQLIRDKQEHPEKYLGVKTGLATFDDRTGGLFPGELTLIAGVTGLGKSTLVKQLQKGIITCNRSKNVLHIANEESQVQVETKFDALMTEIPYLDFKLANVTDEDIEEWQRVMEVELKKPEIGRIFVKEIPAFTDVTLVEQAYRELESQGINIDVIIIDHLPHIVPIMKAWGENDEKAKAAADCKQLAKDLECSLVVPTQAATAVEEKQSKGRRAGRLDVYGSKAQIHVSNTFVMITDKGKVPDDTLEEWRRDVNWLVDIKKNRDGPPFCFRARHYVRYGKVVEVREGTEQEEGEDHSADDEERRLVAELSGDDDDNAEDNRIAEDETEDEFESDMAEDDESNESSTDEEDEDDGKDDEGDEPRAPPGVFDRVRKIKYGKRV